MKKIIFALAAALLAVACTNKEEEFAPDTTLYRSGTVNLCASIEDLTTRMVIDLAGHGLWSEGDKIAVACSDGSFVEFVLNGTGDTKRAIFTGNIPEGKTLGTVAVWPASAVVALEGETLTLKTPVEYSTDDIAYNGVMVANVADSWEIKFNHVMARPTFKLSNYPSSAAYLTLSADGKSLGGRLSMDITSTEGLVAANGSQELKVATPSPATTLSFTVNMPVYEYEAITVKLFDEQDNQLLEQVINPSKVNLPRAINTSLTAALEDLPVKYEPVDVKFIEVAGIKWALGNLQAKEGSEQKGMQEGWRIAPSQWHGFCYDIETSTVSNKTYTYDPAKATEMRYTNTASQFEHFNLGALARNARYYSEGNWMKPKNSSDFDISAKIYKDIEGTAVAEGNDRWANSGTFTSNNSEVWGDLAYWASRGAYRTPTYEEMLKLTTDAYIQAGWIETKDFDDSKDFKVWGFLFTNPIDGQVAGTIVTTERKFTPEEIAKGLFLPKSGRRNNSSSNIVIQGRVQGTYRTTTFIGDGECTSGAKGEHRWYAQAMHIAGTSITWQSTIGSAYDTAAGFLIRPVVNDAYDPENI